jgi:hypothetical protein
MKIRSRQDVTSDNLIQDDEELALIVAFIYNTRMGSKTRAGRAAFRLLDRLSNMFDDTELDRMCADVNLEVTIEDDDGNEIRSNQLTLEV